MPELMVAPWDVAIVCAALLVVGGGLLWTWACCRVAALADARRQRLLEEQIREQLETR